MRESNDAAAIKKAMDEATQKVYTIFGKLYQSQESQPQDGMGPDTDAPHTNPDGSVDVEGEVY